MEKHTHSYKRLIKGRIILLCVVLSIAISACEDKSKREAVINEMKEASLQSRIQRYKDTRMNRCVDGLMAEANRLVDSILIEELKLATDTLGKPPKPLKPLGKEKKVLTDSTPIRPFLKDSLNISQ